MKTRLLTPILILVLLVTSANSADDQKPEPIKLIENVRGSRYCELIVVKGPLRDLDVNVYNTMGCSDCPADSWNQIDADKLAKELQARRVVKNGPRFFLMDKIGQYRSAPNKVTLGGMEMVLRATIQVTPRKIIQGKNKPYEENSVNRSTYFGFNKGQEEYFLKHDGTTYVMQSFGQIVDPQLQEKDLKTLGKRLKLPPGWTYEVRTLTEDLILTTRKTGVAIVIQDELENTYQRID